MEHLEESQEELLDKFQKIEFSNGEIFEGILES